MKKALILLIPVLFLFLYCDKDDSGGDDTSFRAKPEALTKFAAPVTSYDVTTSTTGNHLSGANSKAVIFNSPINGANYVGISLSDNPVSPSYNIKIYYPSNIISNINLTFGSTGFIIKENGSDVTNTGSGSYAFNFVKNTDGTYTITVSGGVFSASSTIIAFYAGTITQ